MTAHPADGQDACLHLPLLRCNRLRPPTQDVVTSTLGVLYHSWEAVFLLSDNAIFLTKAKVLKWDAKRLGRISNAIWAISQSFALALGLVELRRLRAALSALSGGAGGYVSVEAVVSACVLCQLSCTVDTSRRRVLTIVTQPCRAQHLRAHQHTSDRRSTRKTS